MANKNEVRNEAVIALLEKAIELLKENSRPVVTSADDSNPGGTPPPPPGGGTNGG